VSCGERSGRLGRGHQGGGRGGRSARDSARGGDVALDGQSEVGEVLGADDLAELALGFEHAGGGPA
jgi:hypothetical protein